MELFFPQRDDMKSYLHYFISFRVLEILSGFLFLVCLIIFTHVSIERCIHTPNIEEGGITDENSNISWDHITTGDFF